MSRVVSPTAALAQELQDSYNAHARKVVLVACPRHLYSAFRAGTERRQRTPGSGIPCPLGLLRMPSRLAVWVDLASDTCTLLAPVAMRWAWALLMAFATGAVTVR